MRIWPFAIRDDFQEKTVEVRSWFAKHGGGRIAIHASANIELKKVEALWAADRAVAQCFADQGWMDRDDLRALPRGAGRSVGGELDRGCARDRGAGRRAQCARGAQRGGQRRLHARGRGRRTDAPAGDAQADGGARRARRGRARLGARAEGTPRALRRRRPGAGGGVRGGPARAHAPGATRAAGVREAVRGRGGAVA